jgi:hypothetical protein
MGDTIGIHKNVLQLLDKPQNLLFWWSNTEQALVLGAGQEDAGAAIPIANHYYEKRDGLKIGNKDLMKAIQNLTGWKNGTNIRMPGRYLPQQKMVAFRISDATMEVHIHVPCG